ncbi:MAG: hypothetical protein MZW92_67920 [Comamonadaceae bacterium]|nr:hypothetical protein [Comamonadaceae bacterium]
MTEIWAQAALWLGLALLATLVSIRLRIATALSEIVVGTIAQLILGALLGGGPARRRRLVGEVPVRCRRHRAHLPRRRGTRSGGVPRQVA